MLSPLLVLSPTKGNYTLKIENTLLPAHLAGEITPARAAAMLTEHQHG
jgi:hypothetical protein